MDYLQANNAQSSSPASLSERPTTPPKYRFVNRSPSRRNLLDKINARNSRREEHATTIEVASCRWFRGGWWRRIPVRVSAVPKDTRALYARVRSELKAISNLTPSVGNFAISISLLLAG